MDKDQSKKTSTRVRQLDFILMQANMLGMYLEIMKDGFDAGIVEKVLPKIKELREVCITELAKIT